MTPTQEAAMRQALEALSCIEYEICGITDGPSKDSTDAAIDGLRAALAEEAMQRLTDVQQEIEAEIKVDKAEPVAWYHVPYPNNGISPMVSLSQQHEPSMYGAVVPLYLVPPIMEPEIKVDKEAPVAWEQFHEHMTGPFYRAPPKRKPLTPQSPCEMTQAEYKMFRLGWLECEAAHGIKGEA